MKHRKIIAAALAAVMLLALVACGQGGSPDQQADTPSDQELADEVAALIDAIYVQERTDKTDEQCAAAKAAWDKLTDAQKALVEGEEADPDYFGRDTGDASKDDPRNDDGIGKNELLVVSFGTSFNDSRALDIKGIEDALQAAYPDWAVRRAFTARRGLALSIFSPPPLAKRAGPCYNSICTIFFSASGRVSAPEEKGIGCKSRAIRSL